MFNSDEKHNKISKINNYFIINDTDEEIGEFSLPFV